MLLPIVVGWSITLWSVPSSLRTKTTLVGLRDISSLQSPVFLKLQATQTYLGSQRLSILSFHALKDSCEDCSTPRTHLIVKVAEWWNAPMHSTKCTMINSNWNQPQWQKILGSWEWRDVSRIKSRWKGERKVLLSCFNFKYHNIHMDEYILPCTQMRIGIKPMGEEKINSLLNLYWPTSNTMTFTWAGRQKWYSPWQPLDKFFLYQLHFFKINTGSKNLYCVNYFCFVSDCSYF